MYKNTIYLKLTDACQTNAKRIKRTGIIGKTSTIGSKGAYASGNFASKKVITNKDLPTSLYLYKFFSKKYDFYQM